MRSAVPPGPGLEKEEKALIKNCADLDHFVFSSSMRRSSTSRSFSTVLKTTLRAIPGVGARNEERLVASGVTCLEDLRGLAEKHSEKVEALAEFLRSDVGIVHYRHAEAIASFAMELEASSPASEDETFSDEAPPQQLTLSLEGNIGVGKSTFLDAMASGVDRFEVVQEPVDQWRGMGEGEGSNLLEAFYSNPSRYAYTFQNYVLLSRVQQAASQQQRSRGVSTSARMARRAMAPPELLRSAPSTADWSDAVPPVLSGFGGGDPQQIIQPLNSGRIMERSIFSDRIVFAQAVRQAKWMSSLEMGLYESTFDSLLDTTPNVVPDGFIYLRAKPETCLSRLERRGRVEEGGISLEYLTELHENHEGWLGDQHLCVDGDDEFQKIANVATNPSWPARIGWINGQKSHAAIDRVPALILEYDNNVNFNDASGAAFQRKCVKRTT